MRQVQQKKKSQKGVPSDYYTRKSSGATCAGPGRARQLMPARGHPRAYPPPPACDVLDWREAASVGGVYGVGLQLGAQPPPVVQRVSQLLDPDGEGEGVGRE